MRVKTVAEDAVLGLGVALGLGSAVAWGAGDFVAGIAARRTTALAVTAGAQATGLLLLLGLAAVLHPAAPLPTALLLAAIGGLFGGIGLAALYAGLAIGNMGLVSAISGVGAVVIPLSVGTLLQGVVVAPIQLAGVACAVAAAVAGSAAMARGVSARSLMLAAVAAVGFGGWFVFVDLAARDDRLWALIASRAAATVLIGGMALVRGQGTGLRRNAGLIVAAGASDVTANGLVVISFASIPTGVAAALSGMYPLVTMLLAHGVLGERLPRLGLAAVGLATAGIVLISMGG